MYILPDPHALATLRWGWQWHLPHGVTTTYILFGLVS